MALIRRAFLELLLSLSEWEARLAVPGRSIPFRKLYLRYAGVKHQSRLWIGICFRLVSSGTFSVGERCAIGAYSRVQNYSPITIGDDFLSASGLTLVSGGHDVIDNSPLNAPIHIGDRVWCGVNVTILAGVSIGDDVVIAAGSVVVSDIPSNSLAAGVPAVVKKTLDRSNVKQYWSLWGSGNGKDE